MEQIRGIVGVYSENIENLYAFNLCVIGTGTLCHRGRYLTTKTVNLPSKGFTTDMGELVNLLRAQDKSKPAISTVHKYEGGIENVRSPISLDGGAVHAFRENGVQPLIVGEGSYGCAVATESVALQAMEMDSDTFYDVPPGYSVRLDESGINLEYSLDAKEKRLCLYEFLHWLNPCSKANGIYVDEFRRKLAEIFPRFDGDVVIPIPEAAKPIAERYAEITGIEYLPLITPKNLLAMETMKGSKEMILRERMGIVKNKIEGKRIILVDDIKRTGETSYYLTERLKRSGAKSVDTIVACEVKESCPHKKHEVVSKMDEKKYENNVNVVGPDKVLRLFGGLEKELCADCF